MFSKIILKNLKPISIFNCCTFQIDVNIFCLSRKTVVRWFKAVTTSLWFPKPLSQKKTQSFRIVYHCLETPPLKVTVHLFLVKPSSFSLDPLPDMSLFDSIPQVFLNHRWCTKIYMSQWWEAVNKTESKAWSCLQNKRTHTHKHH